MKSERIPVKSFSADNGFIGKMQKLVREEVLPYQYNILNDAIPGIEKSHAIENIRLAAEKLRGRMYCMNPLQHSIKPYRNR